MNLVPLTGHQKKKVAEVLIACDLKKTKPTVSRIIKGSIYSYSTITVTIQTESQQ